MKHHPENFRFGRELREEELQQTTGGYDDNSFCGTVPRRFPRPLGPSNPGVHPVEVLN